MHLNTSKMRISFQEQYFSFNRIILLTLGLWPYQQSKFVRLQIMILSGILISNIVFQVHMSIIHTLVILYMMKYIQFEICHLNENKLLIK